MAATAGFRAWLAVYLKGACMGAADTVPGVSGGTIAVVVGIYERLITALTSIDPRAIRHLGRVHTSDGRAELAAELTRMEVPFLLVLGAGVLSAAATIATVVKAAVVRYPAPTYAFFSGLIAASAVVLYRYVDPATPRRGLVAVVGFLFAFAVTDPTLTGAVDPTPATLFIAGAVAVSAMVLPGISGAFLLLVMGHYEYVSGIPRAVGGGLADAAAGSSAALVDALVPFFSFVSGAVVGVFSVAYVVRAALERYREATLVFLVSLMIGALRLPAHEVSNGISSVTVRTVAVVCGPAAVGVAAVFALEYATDELGY